MLNELELRRPTFLGGRPVTLADGQEWTVPVAERLFILDESAEEGFRTISRFNGKPDEEFDRLWKAYEEATTGADIVRSNLKLMLYMLQLNYDIDAATAAPLIPIGCQADKPDPINDEFLAAGRGLTAEKRSAVGSDSLLEPTAS